MTQYSSIVKIVKLDNSDNVISKQPYTNTNNNTNNINNINNTNNNNYSKKKTYKSPYRTRTDEIIDKYLPTNEIKFKKTIPDEIANQNRNIPTKLSKPNINVFNTAPVVNINNTKPISKTTSKLIPCFSNKIQPSIKKQVSIKEPICIQRQKQKRISSSKTGKKITQYMIQDSNKSNKSNKSFKNDKIIQQINDLSTSINIKRSKYIRNKQTKPTKKPSRKSRQNITYKFRGKPNTNKITITHLDAYYSLPDSYITEQVLSKYTNGKDYYHPDYLLKIILLLTYNKEISLKNNFI